MTHKERVYSALRHEPADIIPRFVWFGNGILSRMREKEGLDPLDVDLKFGNDVLQTWVSMNGEMARDVPDGSTFTDEWGITWQRESFDNTAIIHPMAGLSTDEIKAYPLPDPKSPERFKHLEYLKSKFGSTHFIGADVSSSLFDPACHLRGMEEFMVDLASQSEEAEILLDRLEEFNIELSIECIKRGADWIWLGDDVGSQRAMLISPEMWRESIKPRMERIILEIRKHSDDVFIAYHSCGSIRPIISDLVQIGIEVLNPIQESACDMNQNEIKNEFGEQITLMCGVDTQSFLPTASPDEIKRVVAEKIETLGRGGGYIFAASHTIQHDTPEENISALFTALDDTSTL